MIRHHYRHSLKGHGTTILTTCAAIGVVVTSVLTALCTKTYLEERGLKDEVKEENPSYFIEEEPLPKKIVKVAKYYIPAIVSGCLTTFCVFGSYKLSKKQYASLLAAATVVKTSYDKYKKKVEETVSKEDLDKIEDGLMGDAAKEQSETLIENAGESNRLYYETYSKRYFWSNPEAVLEAEYHYNRNFTLAGTRSIQEFYDFLGLDKEENEDYADIGYNCKDFLEDGLQPWIDFIHRDRKRDDGTPFTQIDFAWDPRIDYENDLPINRFGMEPRTYFQEKVRSIAKNVGNN